MTGRTLDGIAVGISISESSDPHDVGFDSDQVNRITVRLIQALLGHKDVRTTMVYTHLVDRGPFGVISPLDRVRSG